MSHQYIRHNYGDNCYYADTSWKRYQRYHNGGDTLIFNYGNTCCGGHGVNICGGSTFWSGLGMGLANGLSGLLGGLMGGFGNMFGMMGMPFGGMMGGMPMSFYGAGGAYSPAASGTNGSNGTSNSSSSTTTHYTTRTVTEKDKDQPKITDFMKRLDEIKNDPKAEDAEGNAKKLYNDIKAKIENPEDQLYAKNNINHYQYLLGTLKELAGTNGWDLDANDSDPTKGDAQKGAKAGNEVNGDQNGAKGAGNKVDADPSGAKAGNEVNDDPNAVNGENADGADVTNATPEQKALIDEINGMDKDAIMSKWPTDAQRNEQINKLKDINSDDASKARAKLKSTFYGSNVNVPKNDFEEQIETIKANFKNIIDKSGKVRNFMNVRNVNITKIDNNKYEITCKAKSGKNLKYGEVEFKDGELIFHGMQIDNDTQHYVLQQNKNGAYELVQYIYHPGYGHRDTN